MQIFSTELRQLFSTYRTPQQDPKRPQNDPGQRNPKIPNYDPPSDTPRPQPDPGKQPIDVEICC